MKYLLYSDSFSEESDQSASDKDDSLASHDDGDNEIQSSILIIKVFVNYNKWIQVLKAQKSKKYRMCQVHHKV